MFERFTDLARQVLVLAQEEARLLGHSFIGTEHILLGLIGTEDGVASLVLTEMGATLPKVRSLVSEAIGVSATTLWGSPPFTPRAKKVLELSLREALQLGDSSIGTEHILLGVLREGEGVATQVLVDLGIEPSRVRQQIDQRLSDEHRRERGQRVHGVPSDAPGAEEAGRAAEAVNVARLARQVSVARSSPGMIQPIQPGSCLLCGRDLWEVDHYVSSGQLSVCEICIRNAAAAVDAARPEDRSITLPPRIFGDPPDERAVGEITDAVCTVGDPTFQGDLSSYLQDADELAPLLKQARERHNVGRVAIVVRRIRFSGSERAWVELLVTIGDGGLNLTFDGPVVREDGRWKVSRELQTSMLGRAGIRVPPTE